MFHNFVITSNIQVSEETTYFWHWILHNWISSMPFQKYITVTLHECNDANVMISRCHSTPVQQRCRNASQFAHDDVIKWKHVPRHWPFVREFTGHRWFPAQRPVTRNFDVLFDLHLNKRLSKQSWGWWLRRHHAHYDVTVMRAIDLTASRSGEIQQ